jgi:hypothetical protein
MCPINDPLKSMKPRLALRVVVKPGTDRRSFLWGIDTGLAIARRGAPVQFFFCVHNHRNDEKHRVIWNTPDDVPIVDVPCSCGQPGCFFLKWEEH